MFWFRFLADCVFQGTNHASLLAQAFARHLDVDVRSCVGRRLGDLSQARLTQEQREPPLKREFLSQKTGSCRGENSFTH